MKKHFIPFFLFSCLLLLISFNNIDSEGPSHKTAPAPLYKGFLSVGQQIQQARLAKGLALEDLASAVDLSVTQLETVESGRATPTPDILTEIQIMLDCDIVLDGIPQ